MGLLEIISAEFVKLGYDAIIGIVLSFIFVTFLLWKIRSQFEGRNI